MACATSKRGIQETRTHTYRNMKHPIYGDAVYTYTRKQALEDGIQVSAGPMTKEAGIKCPVYINRSVWSQYVKVPDGVTCQDEQGRLWDIIWMLSIAMRGPHKGKDTMQFVVLVRNGKKEKPIKLKAVIGATDIDNPAPAITIMLPDED